MEESWNAEIFSVAPQGGEEIPAWPICGQLLSKEKLKNCVKKLQACAAVMVLPPGNGFWDHCIKHQHSFAIPVIK